MSVWLVYLQYREVNVVMAVCASKEIAERVLDNLKDVEGRDGFIEPFSIIEKGEDDYTL